MDEQRKNRALSQFFYLLNLARHDKTWTIDVKGLTNNYVITLSPNLLKCTCPDYQERENFCKHLYFIILKVAGCYQIILDHQLGITKKMNIASFNKLDNNLINIIIEHFEKNKESDDSGEPSKKKRKVTHECLICLEEITDVTETQECLTQCHKHFHKDCLSKWLRVNRTCPHCRSISSFQLQGNDANYHYDLWEKINEIEIDILPQD